MTVPDSYICERSVLHQSTVRRGRHSGRLPTLRCRGRGVVIDGSAEAGRPDAWPRDAGALRRVSGKASHEAVAGPPPRFDRATWPADFEGRWEPDYDYDAIAKRLLDAEPSRADGLSAMEPVDPVALGADAVAGSYHTVTVSPGDNTDVVERRRRVVVPRATGPGAMDRRRLPLRGSGGRSRGRGGHGDRLVVRRGTIRPYGLSVLPKVSTAPGSARRLAAEPALAC